MESPCSAGPLDEFVQEAGPSPSRDGQKHEYAAGRLFPPIEVRSDLDNWLTLALTEAKDRVRQGRVSPAPNLNALFLELEAFDFEVPRRWEDVLPWVLAGMENGVVHVDHPRYFGLFNPTPTFAAQCADRIAASFNPQLATATTSPFPVALEAHVIGLIAKRLGLPVGSAGHFTSGGSEANAAALICALTKSDKGFASAGARVFSGTPTIHVSKDAHLVWIKLAHLAGIGRDAVRLVESDGHGRIDPAALIAAIELDLSQGKVPVMIASTAGTTAAGMVDPLFECSRIAKKYKMWHHVDAAWGGALIASPRLAGILAGIETADSTTIDAHKWFATTMGCGMFLTAQPEILSAAFHVMMECMPSSFEGRDPYVTSAQWSRRFVGLRLFLGLAVAGWEGYAEHVERAVKHAAQIASLLGASGWKCLNKSSMAVLCLLPPPGARRAGEIARAVVTAGHAWVSSVNFEGCEVVRVCVTSGETTSDDIGMLVAQLEMHARPVA